MSDEPVKLFPKPRSAAFGIGVGFFILSTLWLVLSDRASALLAANPAESERFQFGFNLLYLLAAGILLYSRFRREEISRQNAEAALELSRNQGSRKEAEERLRQLSRAVEQSPTLVLITDLQGQIEYVNPRFTEVTGYSLDEVKGRNPRFLKTDRTPPETYESLWKSLKQGKVWRGEFCNRKKNGECYWASACISGVTNETGSVTHYVAVQEDITERTQAAEALRESQQRFEAFMGHNPAVAFMKDEQGRYVYTNAHWQRLFQRAPSEAVGKTSRELFTAAVADKLDEHDAVVLSSGQPTEFQELVPTADGVPRTWWVLKFPFSDPSGRRLLGGVALDITERKQAEEVLGQLMEQQLVGVYVVNAEKKLEFVNRKFAELSGYTQEEILSRPSVLEIVVEADRPLIEERITQRLRGLAQRNDVTFRVRRKDGAVIHVEAHGTKVEFRGKPAVLGVMIDITEKTLLERQLLHLQRLESIGTMAGGMAHDLNNILAPILLSTGLLRSHLKNQASQKILDTVQTAAQRGAEIVRQVLTFARGIEGERAPVDLHRLIGELSRMCRETFPKDIAIEKELPEDLWPVIGDGTQLHQVLLNLCVNARDAMPSGGTLTLIAGNVELDAQYASMNPDARPGPYLRLQVSDTGAGIPPEILDRIFDPFFSTKAKGQGTGLGLSTSLGIVRAHGGFLRVESRPGHGSSFQVYLPATPQAKAAPPPASSPDWPAGRGELILVVDDEAMVRETTQATLESHGYRVLTAGDGVEGLALYAQHQSEVRAVLTDVMMPVMDGIAMVRALKKMNPELAVVASSGLSSGVKQGDIEAVGIGGFLHKPFVAEELLAVLGRLLHQASGKERLRKEGADELPMISGRHGDEVSS